MVLKEEAGVSPHRKCTAWKWVLAVAILIGVRLIFGFSGMEAGSSNSLSKWVTAGIQHVTGAFFDIHPADQFWRHDLNNIIRKLGHVTEYAVLGVLVCSFVNVWTHRVRHSLWIAPLFCLLVACVDEYIQMFSDGRGPAVGDVLLDTISATLAVLVTGCVIAIMRRFQFLKHRVRQLECELEDWRKA